MNIGSIRILERLALVPLGLARRVWYVRVERWSVVLRHASTKSLRVERYVRIERWSVVFLRVSTKSLRVESWSVVLLCALSVGARVAARV